MKVKDLIAALLMQDPEAAAYKRYQQNPDGDGWFIPYTEAEEIEQIESQYGRVYLS